MCPVLFSRRSGAFYIFSIHVWNCLLSRPQSRPYVLIHVQVCSVHYQANMFVIPDSSCFLGNNVVSSDLRPRHVAYSEIWKHSSSGREDVGIIYYVMTNDGPEEKDNIEHDLDYEHYRHQTITSPEPHTSHIQLIPHNNRTYTYIDNYKAGPGTGSRDTMYLNPARGRGAAIW